MFIKKTITQCSSKWISLKQAVFTDKNNNDGLWDFVERNNDSKAVTIICKSEKGNYLLIKQPRIPINSYEIAFPAGLIDKEESIEQAALRELKEETGYTGTVNKISSFTPKSAGITNEVTSIVFCQTVEEEKGEQELDGSEEIECFWINPEDFFDFVQTLDENEVKIANDLYCFMAGLNFH
ncbi:MAG: NUDIX domain-containing protein [Candidatus Hodarchaeales archaeon]|jgi:8-oxo-dGTP pyrophosphatase MutT (NUDIX family)